LLPPIIPLVQKSPRIETRSDPRKRRLTLQTDASVPIRRPNLSSCDSAYSTRGFGRRESVHATGRFSTKNRWELPDNCRPHTLGFARISHPPPFNGIFGIVPSPLKPAGNLSSLSHLLNIRGLPTFRSIRSQCSRSAPFVSPPVGPLTGPGSLWQICLNVWSELGDSGESRA